MGDQMNIGMLFKVLRNLWLIKLFSKKNRIRIVKEIKERLLMPLDEQLKYVVEDFKVAIREADFVRKYYPELLSVEDPEDFLSIRITPEYPEPTYFTQFESKILTYSLTSGTTLGKPKKIPIPLTKKSLEVLLKANMAFVALANLDKEKYLFRRSFMVAEPGLASERYASIVKMTSKKMRLLVRGKDDIEGFLRRTKEKFDCVMAELPCAIKILDYVKKYPDKFYDDLVFLFGGDILSKQQFEYMKEVRDSTGINFEVLNIYGSTEGLMKGIGVIFDKNNPYYAPFYMTKPVYLTSIVLGAELTSDSFKAPEYPKNFIHKMSKDSEFLVVVTAASVFAVPNYLVGDIAVLKDSWLWVMGRNIVVEHSLPFAVEAYTSPVIRISGIVVKQTLSKIIEEALETPYFVVYLRTGGKAVVMDILVEKDVPSNAKERILKFIEKNPEHSYLIRDIEQGFLDINIRKFSGIKSFISVMREAKGREPPKIYRESPSELIASGE